MRISHVLHRNRQLFGGRTATSFTTRERTWTEHAERVGRLAGGMARLGVKPGDRVAMLAVNSDRYLEWFFAASWLGCPFVPVNTRLALPEMVHWLTDSTTSMLFVDDRHLPLLGPILDSVPSIRSVCYVGDEQPPSGVSSFEDLIESGPPVEETPGSDSDLAGIFYTGGSTGTSKGVMLSHRNLTANALQNHRSFGYDEQTVYLHAAPMFHLANGLGMFLTALAGGTSTMVPSFEAAAVLATIESARVTSTVMVPTMVNMVNNHPDATRRDLSSWDSLIYGGAPMTASTIEGLVAVAPHVRLFQTYGQTEASPIVTMLPPERHVFAGALAGKIASAGQAVPGLRVAVLDHEGKEVPRAQVGEICAQGDTVMLGYLNRPEETAHALRGGWLHTGDAGYMDADGFVFVVDRLKDMIISGGENVYCAEVENALAAHSDVLECAVFGIPHEKWGETVHAVVRARETASLTPQALIDHCRLLIANYKCPRSVEIRTEELPKSGAGKIQKQVLRAAYR